MIDEHRPLQRIHNAPCARCVHPLDDHMAEGEHPDFPDGMPCTIPGCECVDFHRCDLPGCAECAQPSELPGLTKLGIAGFR